MAKIALSGWSAYAPFRASRRKLADLGIELIDAAPDRVEGLLEGRYAASPLSTYALVEALPKFGADIALSWIAVEPVGYGSDRIIANESIHSIADLFRSRVAITANGLEPHLFEHLFDLECLEPKEDYVKVPDRSHYRRVVRDEFVKAFMAPQPLRSQLLEEFPEFRLFDADRHLPRFGLVARSCTAVLTSRRV